MTLHPRTDEVRSSGWSKVPDQEDGAEVDVGADPKYET